MEKEENEYARIKLVYELDRDRTISKQYDENHLFYRRRIENFMYELGKLDERRSRHGS